MGFRLHKAANIFYWNNDEKKCLVMVWYKYPHHPTTFNFQFGFKAKI